jgi:choloylglycine hydrolase
MVNKAGIYRLAPIACIMVAAAAVTGKADACTRAVYLGPDNMIVTGRTMDWKEDPQSNIYFFPRGMERRGGKTDNTIKWTSVYGSVVTAGYDIGVCDGMNEKGLVANLLFLAESDYHRPDDKRPVMGLSIWTQYVLDNFATVDEAVEVLGNEVFRIDDPDLPNGAKSTLHLSISDPTGNSAIFEYINGNLVIHHGRDCQVMTNSPTYDKQQTLDDYWEQIGGLVMLPGTNRASDRFVRASFYIKALPQTADYRQAVAGVFSVMRNVSVPLGISIPSQPNIASTRWRTVADQKNRVYYFESTLSPDIFWIDLNALDFSADKNVRKLTLTNGEIYSGDAAAKMQDAAPLSFLFGI